MTPLSRRSEKPDRSTYYRRQHPQKPTTPPRPRRSHNARPNQHTALGGFSRQLMPRNVRCLRHRSSTCYLSMLHTLGGSMARIETGTNDSSTELPMNNTPQRKRWLVTASVRGPRGRHRRRRILVELRVPVRPDRLGCVEPLHGPRQRRKVQRRREILPRTRNPFRRSVPA